MLCALPPAPHPRGGQTQLFGLFGLPAAGRQLALLVADFQRLREQFRKEEEEAASGGRQFGFAWEPNCLRGGAFWATFCGRAKMGANWTPNSVSKTNFLAKKYLRDVVEMQERLGVAREILHASDEERK